MPKNPSHDIPPVPSRSPGSLYRSAVQWLGGSSWGRQPQAKIILLTLGILLCAGIFAYDMTHELGMSVALLYVLVVVIVSFYPYPYAPFMAGAFTSILALTGWILPPHDEDSEQPFFRRLLALLAIWGTAWWLWRYQTEEKRFLTTLEASEQRLNLALESGRMKTWEWDPATDALLWDTEFSHLSGSEFPLPDMTLESFLTLVNPDDRARVRQSLSQVLQGREFLETEFRMGHPDGHMRWVAVRGRPAVGSNGQHQKIIGIHYDISDRKEKEVLLQESRHLAGVRLAEIEGIYQSAPIGLCVLDSDLRYVRINQRLAEMHGIPAQAHLGRRVNEIVPDLAVSAEPVFRRVLQTGESLLNQEIIGETPAQPGRRRVWVEHILPLKNSEGRTQGINVVVEEVTEQYAAQQALQESETLARRRLAEIQILYNTAPIGLCFLDTELRFVKINSTLAHMADVLPEELIGQTLREGLPRIADHLEPHCRQVLATDRPVVNVEIPATTAAHPQNQRMYLASYHPVKSETGEPYGINVMVIDITDRKKTETALKESESRFRMMGDDAPVIIWITDGQGSIQYLNRQWYVFTGTTHEHDPDQCRFDCLHPEDRQVFTKVWESAKARHHAFRMQYRLRRQDGTYRWMADSASPRMGSQKECVGFIGSMIDVTDIKEAEEIVAKHNVALEQKVRQRTDDLIAHRDQLRKLASELTLTEQRERRRLATELHDYLAQLLVVCRMKLQQAIPTADPMLSSLLREVDTVLEESLNYTRTLVAEISPQILYEQGLPEALNWLAIQMLQHGLRVHVEAETTLPAIHEDQGILLYQTVRELLFNVLKHAGTDSATVSLKQINGFELEVKVMDQGKGCDVSQITANLSHDKFGLMNIRERIEAMEGRLIIESPPGKGTQVVTIVPLRGEDTPKSDIPPALLQSLPAAPREELPASRSSRISVLLVDDHVMVRDGLKNILAGHQDIQVIGEAADGLEAIYLTQVHLPDVVVMDVNMPKLNGMKAARQIVKDFSSTKVIGLSINDDHETISSMREAGAVAYVNKGSAATQLYPAICEAYEQSPKH